MFARGEIFTHASLTSIVSVQLITDTPHTDKLKIYVDLITIK
ncbi:hypothetical protein yfred0001_1390 [Yersinia frederiksenii ATCC 33641]|nr:hypothetical protein yfred0001_1390 [Yersinia frederiksenii ATCC 33641]